MAATADNTRRRLSVDFLLNGGQSLPTTTSTSTISDTTDDAGMPQAGSTASASPSTNTSPRSSGSAHATRCADVLSGATQKLPPLASLLSSSAPAVTTAAAAQHVHRPAYQHHGRRRSWSTGGVVRPSAYIPPASAQNWGGVPPDRRPIVTVATSGPLARAPPAHASRSSFFLPITSLPVVLDIDRDLEDAEQQYRQRQLQQQQQQQLNYQHQLQQQQRQRRPQQTQMTLLMQKRKLQQADLDRDEEEVARMLADSNRWVMTVHDPSRRPGAAVGPHAASLPRGGRDRMVIAEAENVMSPAEDARRMQQHSKRRRHSAAPTLVAEAQRLFSSHLAATPILPASEAKELAAAKYGTATAQAAPCDAMDEVPAAQAPASVESAKQDAVALAVGGEDNSMSISAPAIAPTYRKAEAFQFSADQQDLLLQVLERTQQREAQRSNGTHNSEMDYSSEGRSDSISGASSTAGGSSSGDDGDDGDDDEVGRLQRMAKKRKRVNAQQLAVLEDYFAVDPMPNTLVKLKLAETLGMSPKRVQIWFQNKRARLKKGEQKKLQELQQRHAASRLLTYHNLRIDDNGHIVFKDTNNENENENDNAKPAHEDSEQQQQFMSIQPQPTTTASAM